MEIDAPTNDVIAMHLTIAALEQWLKHSGSDRNGEQLGREIGAMYREIHAAVDDMSPDEEEEDFDFEDDDEEEEDEEEVADERD